MKIVYSFFVFIFFTFSLFAKENHAVVLQYHRFDESKYPSTSISMELFAKQMEHLVQNHYNVWPLSKIVRYLQQKRALPEKTVAITIDDAYKSAYIKAYPLLKKLHLPFTLFVNSLPVMHHSENYLTWDELREMGQNGAEFANHSYSHPYLMRKRLKNVDDYEAYVKTEVEKCEEKLKKELGSLVANEPKMFAYPFGEYDTELLQIIKGLDYVGVAQNSAPISSESNFMELTRFPMSGGFGAMEQFKLKVDTLPLPLESVKNEDTLVDESNNPPSLTLRLKKPLKALQCFTADGKKIQMEWLSDTEITVQATEPLLYPRNHYTCTAPAQDGRWYWYSHLWVILEQ
ncbi:MULTISPECIES: polysaccharide deacetylase family protein [Sulfurimonas]|uniref:polysaccharide deacetylase family protein n=1 Tax=Sulfurimonas TaxID=202746 RepID=UPI001263DAEF|nr:polysaccharide deacetylase family protein [Sulfurimonas indica]